MALSQTERNKIWASKNKEHAKYLNARSRSRSFIRNSASLEDLNELESLIDQRRALLKKDSLNLDHR